MTSSNMTSNMIPLTSLSLHTQEFKTSVFSSIFQCEYIRNFRKNNKNNGCYFLFFRYKRAPDQQLVLKAFYQNRPMLTKNFFKAMPLSTFLTLGLRDCFWQKLKAKTMKGFTFERKEHRNYNYFWVNQIYKGLFW